jgi:all-trans-retinol dehydrogenase (NAD+)
MRSLRNKRVLITGGAQGIGREIALSLSKEGCELILTDINEEQLQRTVKELSRRVVCRGYLMDVTQNESILKARDEIHRDGGPIDVLVNNAGIVFGGPFLEVALEKHLATYKVNTEGMVAVTHAFLSDLLERSEAHLVNVASASGLIGLPYGSTYASSKWAAIGFSESIRLELKEMGASNVHVTTVCPGYVNTGMFDGVKSPLLMPMLDPRKLGQKIIEAMKKDLPFVLEPWMVKLTPLLKGVMPIPIVDRISWIMGVTGSMQSWKGH